MSDKKPAEMVGDVIARLIPVALMAWAMVETENLLLKLLLALWLLFVVSLWALVAAGWDAAAYARSRAERAR